MGSEALLTVDDLDVDFGPTAARTDAVNGISFEISAGETLGIVGESGCGKSVTSLAILGILPRAGRVTRGSALFAGLDLFTLPDRDLRQIRGEGDRDDLPGSNVELLYPVLTVGKQIREVLEKHFGMDRSAANARAKELLDQVGTQARRHG